MSGTFWIDTNFYFLRHPTPKYQNQDFHRAFLYPLDFYSKINLPLFNQDFELTFSLWAINVTFYFSQVLFKLFRSAPFLAFAHTLYLSPNTFQDDRRFRKKSIKTLTTKTKTNIKKTLSSRPPSKINKKAQPLTLYQNLKYTPTSTPLLFNPYVVLKHIIDIYFYKKVIEF